MPVDKENADQGLIIAALFALATDWDDTEVRQGRRGDYRTTGASMYRIRKLEDKEVEQLQMICGVLGRNVSEEDINELFAGDFEYQISYACNRFETAGGRVAAQRLTNNEMRTLERAKQILLNKEQAATTVMTTPADKRRAA